jgi:RNA binding exosome subunit
MHKEISSVIVYLCLESVERASRAINVWFPERGVLQEKKVYKTNMGHCTNFGESFENILVKISKKCNRKNALATLV